MTLNEIAVAMEEYADEIHGEYDRETAKRLYKWAAEIRDTIITREQALGIGRDAIVFSTLPAVSVWQSAADVVTNAVYDALTGGNQAGTQQGPVTPSASAAP